MVQVFGNLDHSLAGIHGVSSFVFDVHINPFIQRLKVYIRRAGELCTVVQGYNFLAGTGTQLCLSDYPGADHAGVGPAVREPAELQGFKVQGFFPPCAVFTLRHLARGLLPGV